MISLDTRLRIPPNVLFTTVEGSAVLLNALTNRYFSLDDVGARFWSLLTAGTQLREACRILLAEYDVTPDVLEHDILDLLQQLLDHQLLVAE